MSIEVISVPDSARILSADWLRQITRSIQWHGLIRERLLLRFVIGVIAVGAVLGADSLLRSYKYYSRIIDARLASGYLTSRPGLYPFYVSRLLNSLDHITGGRMAFNVVTSTRRADAANYGYDELMEHNSRYDRMEEFVQVCKALWASVEPDAFVWDRETGVVIPDPKKVRAINHKGAFFKVKGPLSCVPSPQGRPVLIQAGGSPRGIEASAQFADCIFAALKPRKMNIKHREELDKELKAAGRDPSKVEILWDIVLVVGETTEEAGSHKGAASHRHSVRGRRRVHLASVRL